MKKRAKLTEAEWSRVFRLRCHARSGHTLSDTDQALVTAAWKENETRYKAMNDAIFDATVPAGSTVRARR